MLQVVSFDNLEDEEIEARGQDWDRIIPEQDIAKIEEEERHRKLMEMNIGPRERKQIQDVSNSCWLGL